MKMERFIQGTLGVLAATAVFGAAAQTAAQTQPKSSITTSPAASSSTGAAGTMNQPGNQMPGEARDSSMQRGENATRMPHPPTGTGAVDAQTPGQNGTAIRNGNMNSGTESRQVDGMNRSGTRMEHGGTRMEQGGTHMDQGGTRMEHGDRSTMPHGTADRMQGETRTSGSQGGENASRMPHPPTGSGEAIGVPGQPGSTMSSGGEGNRAGSAKPQ